MSDKTQQAAFPEQFAALGVRPSILRALAEEKFTQPTDIQALLIPKALEGVDILGQARTGTGKTAAFAIPILQRAMREGPTQAIILVPTRELAVQVDTEIKRFSRYTPIRSVAVYGGQRISAQMKFLKNGPQIVVGTPGRVIDLLDRRIIDFAYTHFVVLDEVDRMLDIGFRDDIRNILSRIGRDRKRGRGSDGASKRRTDGGGDGRHEGEEGGVRGQGTGVQAEEAPDVHPGLRGEAMPVEAPSAGEDTGGTADNWQPATGNFSGVQTIFVSATIADEVERLARTYMKEPVVKLIAPGADEKPTVAEVEQFYFSVPAWDKHRLVRMLLERENPDLAIVFCKTKHGAHKLARKLENDGIACREIHGNLAQNKRDRVMKSFRGGKFDVLVATDLASRGIDVADISHIINYDIPEDPEVYVHRVGRTARMGAKGKAFTLVTPEQGEELTKVEALINMLIPQATIEGFQPSPPPRGEEPVAAPKPVREEPAVALPVRPLTLGSKIPLSRRHRRRR